MVKNWLTLAGGLTVALIAAMTLPAVAVQVGPGVFGPSTKTEDFEGLANVALTQIIFDNYSNPHYGAQNSYWFNGDFHPTMPMPNPPDPTSSGAVAVGDFTQGTQRWGLGHRILLASSDLHSGSAYLGAQFDKGVGDTMIFTFNSPQKRVGAWVDSGFDYLARVAALDIGGIEIESASALTTNWTFLGIQSDTPIWGMSISGFVPVVDDLVYEIPEPTSIVFAALSGLIVLRRWRQPVVQG